MVKDEGEGKERRRRRDVSDEEDDDKKGFSWTPILLLLMMIGPGLVPAMEYIFVLFNGPKNLPPDQFRKKLVDFYKKYNPAKLHKKGYLEKLMSKFQENQEHLFQNLEMKYRNDKTYRIQRLFYCVRPTLR
ncbi:hypothetical protein CYMTET_51325 [Cymbomonas tetramitiformis]|uniref:Uncharacterized protein n=1 Tax=Cymbomonas tetramitiformis TaxID=36881 RepID=A0AAE0BMG5_9CHLO|nr:hypothetical protein CYMTET_51325 [Cymbomonas tetramitiformis]